MLAGLNWGRNKSLGECFRSMLTEFEVCVYILLFWCEFMSNCRLKDKFGKGEEAFSVLGETIYILGFVDFSSLLNFLDIKKKAFWEHLKSLHIYVLIVLPLSGDLVFCCLHGSFEQCGLKFSMK